MQYKLYILSICLVLSASIWADGKANLCSMTYNKPTNYESRVSSDGWVAMEASIEKPPTCAWFPGECYVILNGNVMGPGSLESPNISGGLKELSFNFAMPCLDNMVAGQLDIYCNDTLAYTTKFGGSITRYATYTWKKSNFKLEGPIRIVFNNLCPTCSPNNADRLALFNIQWKSYTGLPDPYVEVVDTALCYDQLPYVWTSGTGKEFYRDTIAIDTLKGSRGQDSIYLLLKLHALSEPIEQYDTVYLRPGQQYVWPVNGKPYAPTVTTDDSQIYRYVYFPQCIAESYYLHMEVVNNLPGETYERICYGDSLLWDGQWRKQSGNYKQLLPGQGSYGFDSTSILHLTVTPQPLERYQDTVLCDGSSFEWHGKIVSEAKTYFDTLETTITPVCDSIYYMLNVHMGHARTSEFTDTMCTRETYYWNNLELTTSGTYTAMLTTNEGCDSLCTLHLTVLPEAILDTTLFLCHGDSAYLNGRWFKHSGNWVDTLHRYTARECDSICLIGVYEHEVVKRESVTYSICMGDKQEWLGKDYMDAGTYYDTLLSKLPPYCDSIIYEMHLEVRPTSHKVLHHNVQVSELPYVWHNQSMMKDGKAYYTTLNSAGCDSVTEMRLHVLGDCELPKNLVETKK